MRASVKNRTAKKNGNKKAEKRIIIVGAGISGLTAAAYLARAGYTPLILEKSPTWGGLVASFWREGFLFDTGPRAIGNAGILRPMLEELGIELPLIKGEVSTGIQDQLVHYDSLADIDGFITSLKTLFPAETKEIDRIHTRIRRYTNMAVTLNEMPNPFFRNPLSDMRFLVTRFIPWLPRFCAVVLRSSLFTRSMEDVLAGITSNQSLIDMISQHYFKGTPANFALGYFANMQDYLYPRGGTGTIPQALGHYIEARGGQIQTSSEAVSVDPLEKTLTDHNGQIYPYDALLWAADIKTLYRRLNCQNCSPRRTRSLQRSREKWYSVVAGESAFTIFIAVDTPPETFEKISRGHFIYTPHSTGLGDLHRQRLTDIKDRFPQVSKIELFTWLREFCACNSYEISIPALKNPSLAPPGKTGLIISILMDGELFSLVEAAGWYAEFKEETARCILRTLEASIYPGLGSRIIFQQTATPLTIMRMFGTDAGAITGWSMEAPAPVPSSLPGILGAAKTAIPGLYTAGQWSYSPSGVPIAMLTGRIAASAIRKHT